VLHQNSTLIIRQ